MLNAFAGAKPKVTTYKERLKIELNVCRQMQELPLVKKSKIFDDCIYELTGLKFEELFLGNKKDFTEAMLAALCNQNQSIPEQYDIFRQHETYLIFSIRALFEKLYEAKYNPESNCSDAEKEELNKDIIHNLETLNFLQTIANLPKSATDTHYNKVAEEIIDHLNLLKIGDEYTIATGWRGHAVCINFIRCEGGIAICINNPEPINEPEYFQFHHYEIDQQNVITMRQAVMGVIPINELQKHKSYFATVVKNVHNQSKISFRQGVNHLYFNEELKSLKNKGDAFAQQLPRFEAQAKANCFAQCHQGSKSKFAVNKKSYIVEFAAQLNDEAFGKKRNPIKQAANAVPPLSPDFRENKEEKRRVISPQDAPVVLPPAAAANLNPPAGPALPLQPNTIQELGAFLDSCNGDSHLIKNILEQAKKNPQLTEICEFLAALQTTEDPVAQQQQPPESKYGNLLSPLQQQRPADPNAKQEPQNINGELRVIDILRQLPPSKQALFRNTANGQLHPQVVNKKGPHEINLGALKIVEEKIDNNNVSRLIEVDSVSSLLTRLLKRENKLNGVIFTHRKDTVPLMAQVQSHEVFSDQKNTKVKISHDVNLRFAGIPKSDKEKSKLICVLTLKQVPGQPGKYFFIDYAKPFIVKPDGNNEVQISTRDLEFVAAERTEGTATDFSSPPVVITVAFDYVEPTLAEVFIEAPGGPKKQQVTPKPSDLAQSLAGFMPRLFPAEEKRNLSVVEQKIDFNNPSPLVFPKDCDPENYFRLKSKTAQETLDSYNILLAPQKKKTNSKTKVSLPFFKALPDEAIDDSLDPQTEKLFKEKLGLRLKAYTLMAEISATKPDIKPDERLKLSPGARLEQNIRDLKKFRSKLRKFYENLERYHREQIQKIRIASAPSMKAAVKTPEVAPNEYLSPDAASESITLAMKMGPVSMPMESAEEHGLPGIYRAHTGGPAGIRMDIYHPKYIDPTARGNPEAVINRYQQDVEEFHAQNMGGEDHPFKPTDRQYAKDKKTAESIDYNLVDHAIKHLEYNKHLWNAAVNHSQKKDKYKLLSLHDEQAKLPSIEEFKRLLEDLSEEKLIKLITSFHNNPPVIAENENVIATARLRKEFENTLKYWKDIIDKFEVFLIDQIGIYCETPPQNAEQMTAMQFSDYLFNRLAQEHPELTDKYFDALLKAANESLKPKEPSPLLPLSKSEEDFYKFLLEIENRYNGEYRTHITHPWKFGRQRLDDLEERGYTWDINNKEGIVNKFVRGSQCGDGVELSIMDRSVDDTIGKALTDGTLGKLMLTALVPALQYKPPAPALIEPPRV